MKAAFLQNSKNGIFWLRLQRALGRKQLGYKHFNSHEIKFLNNKQNFSIASLNNRPIDFSTLPSGYRASHFVRDPRDLVVSGYFYHKRGAEPWCNIVDPTENDFYIVNGMIPENIQKGMSFASYLSSLSLEDGLKAEIDFREKHFQCMEGWDFDNPQCLELRYEDIIGNELDAFTKIIDHYQFVGSARKRALSAVEKFAAKNQVNRQQHIRNPDSGQWKQHFTKDVEDYLYKKHPTLLQKTGYESRTI